MPASGSASTGGLTSTTDFTLVCTGAGGSTEAVATVAVAASAPTLDLRAAPDSVASGASTTLTWTTTNATTCAASGGWSGDKASSGSEASGALTAATDFKLDCIGPGGTVSTVVSVAVASPAPAVTLSASPSTIASGASSTLTWTSANVTACAASGSWSGARDTSGTISTGALTATKSYTLTCTGPGGSALQSATVTVGSQALPAPTVTLNASPSTIAKGGSATLTWSTTNATSCTASGAWTGTKATSGSQSTGALNANAGFTLSCTGAGGSASQGATVTVTTPAPTVQLAASPATLANGDSATLTWSSTNATACMASGSWSGAKATSGSKSTGALTATSSYTLVCTGTGGSASQTAKITVSASAPTVQLSVSPTTVASGGSATITWSSANATSCTASGGWSGSLATSGSQSTGAVTASKTYTLACTGTGGTTSRSVTVAVAAAVVVTISGSPVTTVSAGSAYFFTPTVIAATGAVLSFTIQNKPAWATFNTSSGRLSGTPTAAQAGSYANVMISVSDGTTTAALPAFTITVSQVATSSITLIWSPPTKNTDGSSLTDLTGYRIYYGTSANSLTQSATVSGGSTASYTLTGLTSGTWYLAIASVSTSLGESAKSSVVSVTL
jgi:trimeric autotransporter adhesin